MIQNRMKELAASMAAVVLMSVSAIDSTAFAAQPSPVETAAITKELTASGGIVQPIGEFNPSNVHFTGLSYVDNLSGQTEIPVINVTFAHGAHTFWHVHHGSCQVLVPQSGRGYYQIWGQKPQELSPGMTVTIPAGVKHWHGAAPGTSFQHIALIEHKEGVTTEWLEPVDDREYQSLP